MPKKCLLETERVLKTKNETKKFQKVKYYWLDLNQIKLY